ncbi:hypothetical protein ACF0H5_001824 [Mactra antiquata]
MAEKQFKDRDFEQLKKGCLPFCPPARRNWKSVQPIDMGSSLSWLPKDYEKIKPDAKLLEREFVVMYIEKVGTPNETTTKAVKAEARKIVKQLKLKLHDVYEELEKIDIVLS